MFSLDRDPVFSRRILLLWPLLSLQAGAINACGFLLTSRFVSHITGYATHLGLDWLAGRYDLALGMACVPIFFILGAMLSSFLIEWLPQKTKVRPDFRTPLFLIMGSLVTCLGLGQAGFFGALPPPDSMVQVQDRFHMSDHYFLIILLSFACGLQNGFFPVQRGLAIRSTHLTGITTDLASGLVRTMGGIFPDTTARRREIRLNILRAFCIGNFILGSLIAALSYAAAGFLAFLVPMLSCLALIIVVVTCESLLIKERQKAINPFANDQSG